MIASVYLGDALSFAVYAMASQPALYERIRAEADALLDNGDPDADAFTPDATDVTRPLRHGVHAHVPDRADIGAQRDERLRRRGPRNPRGDAHLHHAQAAAHYMPDVFPEPFTFRIAERRRALSV